MVVPAMSPALRRARAVRHQLRRRRRLAAAVLAAAAALAGIRAVVPPVPEAVEVLVAAHDLPAGARLGEGDLVRAAWPADLVPRGATEVSAIGEAPVLASPLSAGEVLTDVRVVGAALAEADPGRTVLPLRLPDAGMASLLRPGDEVDLVATDPGTGQARLLAHDVRVLARPADVPEGPAAGSGGALVLFSVRDQEVINISGAALAEFLTVTVGR